MLGTDVLDSDVIMCINFSLSLDNSLEKEIHLQHYLHISDIVSERLEFDDIYPFQFPNSVTPNFVMLIMKYLLRVEDHPGVCVDQNCQSGYAACTLQYKPGALRLDAVYRVCKTNKLQNKCVKR